MMLRVIADIFGDWARISRRMIVENNHRRGIAPDRLAEDFCRAHDGRIDIAAIDRIDRQNAVAGIQRHHAQLFLFQHAHFV